MSPRVCIIGAGPSGITAAKNMLAEGLTDVTVFEKSDQVGGNWVYREGPGHSSVCETTHIISSKRWSQFEDYPMPASYPDYPSHVHLKDYFQNYAKDFKVLEKVHFHTEVNLAERRDDGKWSITLSHDGKTREEVFDHLVVANGHHWDPVMPTYPGEFSGEIIHSHGYKKAEPFRDKRVLVVGGGNSACDVAVETARVSKKTCISMRRGYYILPKFMFGKPSDTIGAGTNWIPRRVRQWVLSLMIRVMQGKWESYGLQAPQCRPLEMHPTMNSELLYFISHGEVHPKVGMDRFEGNTVHFSDGSSEAFDAIVFATGYRTTFPFFRKDFIDFSTSTALPLYRKMIHADFDNLFFIGLFQPQGCIWPLSDFQARIAAKQIKGSWKRPSNLNDLIAKEIANPHYRWEKATRHAAEVDYHMFRKELLQELKRAS